MDLLTNAIESIQVGVEDWQVRTRPRLLSAVRNIHAGILLMYKEALLRLSPENTNELLIKARLSAEVDAAGHVRMVGSGRKTLDTQQIRDRFQSLGIHTDWRRFEQIAKVRNDIEHYYADVTHESILGVIASAFLIIRGFCVEELEEEPRELLGQATWDTMLQAADVYAAERAECDASLGSVEWASDILRSAIADYSCDSCGSNLLRIEGAEAVSATLECRSCGAVIEAENFIPSALALAFEWDTYAALKDGGDGPLAECPFCFKETYLLEEGRCLYCGHEAEHECTRCGCTIPPSELTSSPLCGYCDHIMAKDD
ncbi:MAG TPA: hypothetical protein VF006_01085 [Longimicrobium sp.]